MIVIHDVEQGSPEWLALRDSLYTGTSADKLLTNSHQYAVINGVQSQYGINTASSFTGNYWTRRGHLLEEEVRPIYEQIFNTRLSTFGFITNTDYPGAGCSVDYIRSDRVIEVKAFDEERHLKIVRSKQVPFKIQAQGLFNAVICEKKLVDIVFYNPKVDPNKAFFVATFKLTKAIKDNFKVKLKGIQYAI